MFLSVSCQFMEASVSLIHAVQFQQCQSLIENLIRFCIIVVHGSSRFGRTDNRLFPAFYRFIILPQAIKNILPAIGNEFITMVKETSIIQYLGISDLMYNNGIVITATYNPLPCYYISAILYLLLNIILGKGINIFEVRLKRNER